MFLYMLLFLSQFFENHVIDGFCVSEVQIKLL